MQQVWLGPNAVLAFAREGYKWSDLKAKDLTEVLAYPGFYKLAKKYLSFGSYEVLRSIFISLAGKMKWKEELVDPSIEIVSQFSSQGAEDLCANFEVKWRDSRSSRGQSHGHECWWRLDPGIHLWCTSTGKKSNFFFFLSLFWQINFPKTCLPDSSSWLSSARRSQVSRPTSHEILILSRELWLEEWWGKRKGKWLLGLCPELCYRSPPTQLLTLSLSPSLLGDWLGWSSAPLPKCTQSCCYLIVGHCTSNGR